MSFMLIRDDRDESDASGKHLFFELKIWFKKTYDNIQNPMTEIQEEIEENIPHFVEWSEIQQSFHIETVEKSLINNTRNYLLGNPIQYYPVAIVNSHKEATEYIIAFEKERDKNTVLKLKTPELIEWRAKWEKAQMDSSDARAEISSLEAAEYAKLKSSE